jgi:glyoxylase I family protein
LVAEWDYGDEKLAYFAPPGDDNLFVGILGGGDTLPTKVRPYRDIGDSLMWPRPIAWCNDDHHIDLFGIV